MGTIQSHRINGVKIPEPLESNDIVLEASFGSENIQPSVTPLDFTFINEAAAKLDEHVDLGNIYVGLDYSMDIIGASGTINVLDGYIDLAAKYERISPVQIISSVKLKNGISNIDEKLQGLTFDLLTATGHIVDSDFTRNEYVVEKPINAIELVIISTTLFMLLKELAENAEKLGEDIAQVSSKVAQLPGGGVGAVVYQIAIVLIRAAYLAVLLKAIIDLIEDILNQFISPVRIKKGITYRTALTKIFSYLGYEFESPIEELDYFTYLPSNNGTVSLFGTPNPQDFGYNCDAFVSLLMRQFQARIVELDGVIHFRTESDVFWIKNSTYEMTDVLLEDLYHEKTNADELVKNKNIKYLRDAKDDWTYSNYKGTSYAVITQHTQDIDNAKDGLKEYEETIFPVALGNRKDSLNTLELALKVLASTADTVTGIFGSNQNFAQRVKNRSGMLKVSHETWSLPKVIYISGGTMPFNHRDLMSAETLYNKYINYDSFVSNNFNKQRLVYSGVEIPFGLENWNETNRNSYFKTAKGQIGKFINIKWNSSTDEAIVDFWIQHVYTDKIKEIFIEIQ